MTMNFVPEIVAAAVLIVILFCYQREAHIPISRNRWFVFSLLVAIASCAVSATSIVVIENAARLPRAFVYGVNDLFFLFSPLMFITLLGYISNILSEQTEFFLYRALLNAISTLMYGTVVLLVIANHFSPVLYSFDADFNYVRGPANKLMVPLTAVYFTIYGFILFLQWKKTTGIPLHDVYAIYFIGIPVFVLQAIFPNVQFQGTAFMLCVLRIYLQFHLRNSEVDDTIGCMNRNTFFTVQKHLYDKTPPKAYIMINITNLKEINDEFGWVAGNLFLKSISDYFRKMSDAGSVFLLTRTQFVVVTNENDPLLLTQTIVERFAKDWKCGDAQAKVNVRIATLESALLTKGDNVAEMLEYSVYKKIPPQKFYVHCDQSIVEAYRKQLHLMRYIRNAIDTKQYHIYYKPVCDITSETNKIVGIACSLILHTPETGRIRINDIVTFMHGYDAVDELNLIVFEKVCALQAKLHDNGLNNIRVSSRFRIMQLRKKSVIERIAQIVNETGASFRSISLEIMPIGMENSLSPLEIAEIIESIKVLGMEASLNDVEYTHIKTILVANPNRVVLNAKQVGETVKNSREEDVMSTIVVMMKNHDIDTVAAHVNTPEALATVKELRVKYANGAALYPMLTEKELMSILNQNRADTCFDAWDTF